MKSSNILYKLSNILNPKIASQAQSNLFDLLSLLLKGTSFQNITYVSGGYVRDLVKNIESSDLDLVVQKNGGAKQLADFILTLFDGYVTYEKLNPNYPTYNLVFKDDIVYGGYNFKVKNADIDISDTAKMRYAEDSGKKELFIYGNLKQDAQQRDFTMNALYQNIITKQIIDPTKLGIQDIKNNLLRLIPSKMQEQKLYNNPKILLRYCRFYAKYQMNILKDDLIKLQKVSDRIKTLQDQQIEKQIKKIHPQKLEFAIIMMKRIGIYMDIQRFL